jgi:hypothetical protein
MPIFRQIWDIDITNIFYTIQNILSPFNKKKIQTTKLIATIFKTKMKFFKSFRISNNYPTQTIREFSMVWHIFSLFFTQFIIVCILSCSFFYFCRYIGYITNFANFALFAFFFNHEIYLAEHLNPMLSNKRNL